MASDRFRTMEVGATFSSYADFLSTFDEYKQRTFTNFQVETAITTSAANKKAADTGVLIDEKFKRLY